MNEVEEIIKTWEKSKRTFRDFLLDLFDLVTFFVFVWWIVLFIRFFLFNPYTVVWQSMEPTFDEKDFIIVDKISHKVNWYKRWDIVVFVPEGKEVPYIKRVVWLPWETVKIQDGKVYICTSSSGWQNCNVLEESYLPSDLKTTTTCGITEFNVTDNAYFVMWDNRNHSTDSRCCFGLGCYSGSTYLAREQDIIWKVSIRLFPSFTKF